MNLKERVIHQLEQLTAKGPEHIEAVVQKAPEQGYIVGISAEDDGAGVSVSLTDFDRYSVTLRHLEVFHNSLIVENGETEHYLHHCAAQIAHRLIYLEEPLALVELNTVDGAAQLRVAVKVSSPTCMAPKCTVPRLLIESAEVKVISIRSLKS